MRRRIETVAVFAALAGLAGCGDGGFSLGAQAQVDWSPQALDFGDVPRGSEANALITIKHVGTGGTIELSPIELISDSADLMVGTIESTSLEVGEESRIQVIYASNDDAPDQGVLRIGLNIASTPFIEIPVKTPGQRGQLIANPGAIDFGVVQAGAPKTVKVELANIGSAAATLADYTIQNDEDGDFSATVVAGTTIAPGESAGVELLYSPSGRNDDEAFITVHTDRDDVSVTFPVEGEEETPELVVEPSVVQFSWVTPGSTKLVTLKIRNEGNTELELLSMELQGAAAGVGITNPPSMPLTLEPGQVVSTGAVFQPTENLAMTGEPIGTLVLQSTDEANNPLTVPLYGAAGIPSIFVSPESVVDFAYVAESFTATRAVTVLNVGDSAVKVTEAELKDNTSDEFAFTNAADLPATLDPGESVVLDLTFENTEGDDGTEFAQFVIHTTDPLIPQYPLDVVARRSEKPTCEPAFVPDILNMGAFKTGSFGFEEMHVVNFGSGNCEYREWDLLGCTKVQSGTRYLFECDPEWPYTPFSVDKAPQYGDIIGPGDSLTFIMRFDAPEIWNVQLGRDTYFGRMALTMYDPNEDWFEYVFPEGGWMKGINLRAESAQPMISVDPGELGYGNVRTGCESDAGIVTITNLGPMDAIISEGSLEGCMGQMVIKNLPALPYTLPGYAKLYLEVAFAPSLDGDQSCSFHLETDALNVPVADVLLDGHGVDVAHQTDTFEQVPAPKVDVLFVIDDSGSMADEQLKLKVELPKLAQLASSWGQDFRMAVTTTDTLLVAGKFKGKPPVAEPGTDMDDWADNMQVGIAGHFEEAGLEGAWLALSGANIADTGIACENKPNACPAGLWCIEGFCQGVNSGFLRDDADLIIIIVSDEEDSSPESVDWYVSHFTSLKNPQSGTGVKIHVIVFPPDGCLGGGFGTPGTRYIAAAKKTGGVSADICATDFTSEYEDISNKTFGLKDQFYPSLPPEPDTIEVRINGEPCASGWEWNENTQSVIFDEDGACWPAEGAVIEIEYDVRCNIPG